MTSHYILLRLTFVDLKKKKSPMIGDDQRAGRHMARHKHSTNTAQARDFRTALNPCQNTAILYISV